jgi:hypothetical protein
LVGDEEDLVLDCYRLARWYHQAPDTFLAMPIDEVRVHMNRTLRLADLMRRRSGQQSTDDDA